MMLDSFVELDADHQIDADQPRPVVFKCLNAHTIRRTDIEAHRPKPPTRRLCAVCGVEIRGQTTKTCSPEHRAFVERQRAAADTAYRKTAAYRASMPFRFPLELQPWYRGGVTAFKAADAPTARPMVPLDWWDGYQRLYGGDPTLTAAQGGVIYGLSD